MQGLRYVLALSSDYPVHIGMRRKPRVHVVTRKVGFAVDVHAGLLAVANTLFQSQRAKLTLKQIGITKVTDSSN